MVNGSETNLNQRRVGKFSISRDMIENGPELVKQILGKCVVVRAEMMFDRDAIEYIAFCDEFDEVYLGSRPPSYAIECSKRIDEDTGEEIGIEFEFRRVH